MIAAANGPAAAREVARCDGADMLSFSWSPDGRALLFGSMTGTHGRRACGGWIWKPANGSR